MVGKEAIGENWENEKTKNFTDARGKKLEHSGSPVKIKKEIEKIKIRSETNK